MVKSAHLHGLCQTSEKYRSHWDSKVEIVSQAIKVTSAQLKWAKEGFPVRSKEEIASLKEVCSTCEHFSQGRCGLCGCYLKVKLRLATESCPDGRW